MDISALKKLFKDSPVTVVRVGNNVEVAFGKQVGIEAIRKGEKALLRGVAVTWPNGVKQWRVTAEVVDGGKTGSAVFTWRGDKVLHNVTLWSKAPDGTLTHEPAGTVWRLMD